MQSWWCSYLVLQGKAPSRDSPAGSKTRCFSIPLLVRLPSGWRFPSNIQALPNPPRCLFLSIGEFASVAPFCALPHDDLKMPRVFPLQNPCHSGMRFAVC